MSGNKFPEDRELVPGKLWKLFPNIDMRPGYTVDDGL